MLNPSATVVLLPADHYYRDEGTITRALRTAGNLAAAETKRAFLLGTDPGGPDSELGYILPAEKIVGKPARLIGFTEKPPTQYAQELLRLGALWNLSILVGSVGALLKLFDEDYAGTVAAMREALESEATGVPRSIERFYGSISRVDFSRDVLEVQAAHLQVLKVPNCGWTDLGTPKRVEATVRSLAVSTTAMGTGAGVTRHYSSP
jgi:mannose-1-phosphate guanylyltransferase